MNKIRLRYNLVVEVHVDLWCLKPRSSELGLIEKRQVLKIFWHMHAYLTHYASYSVCVCEIVDCFYIVLFSALKQIHFACMWFYRSEQLFTAHFWISTEVVYLQWEIVCSQFLQSEHAWSLCGNFLCALWIIIHSRIHMCKPTSVQCNEQWCHPADSMGNRHQRHLASASEGLQTSVCWICHSFWQINAIGKALRELDFQMHCQNSQCV